MPGGADGSGVDIPLRPVDQAALIGLHSQGLQHPFPGAIGSPSQMTPVQRLEFAVTLGHVAPGRSGRKDPEDAVDRAAVIQPLSASAAIGWKEIGYTGPLFVC